MNPFVLKVQGTTDIKTEFDFSLETNDRENFKIGVWFYPPQSQDAVLGGRIEKGSTVTLYVSRSKPVTHEDTHSVPDPYTLSDRMRSVIGILYNAPSVRFLYFPRRGSGVSVIHLNLDPENLEFLKPAEVGR